jgi:hypothetical protein
MDCVEGCCVFTCGLQNCSTFPLAARPKLLWSRYCLGGKEWIILCRFGIFFDEWKYVLQ